MNRSSVRIVLSLFVALCVGAIFTRGFAADPKAKAPAPAKAAPAKAVKPAKPVPPPIVYDPAPTAVLDPAAWKVAEFKGNGFAVGETFGKPSISTTGKALSIISTQKLDVNTRVRAQFRYSNNKVTSSITIAAGLVDPLDAKDRGKWVSVTAGAGGLGWTVFDPNSKARLPQTNGPYRPQFIVERSLNWPEALRANVEADMVASKPIAERLFTLDMVLRDKGYEVSIDGIPLAAVKHETADPRGFGRVSLSPNVELVSVTTSPAPFDDSWVYLPVPLDSVLNSSQVDGLQLAKQEAKKVGEVPFVFAEQNPSGFDHVDVGTSWFRQGNVTGRYSGRGTDALQARWPGALLKDPARIVLRLPMARYRALHLLAAADGEPNSVPVVTAQFYRAQSGFPKNFAAKVPAFTASSKGQDAVPVKTVDGKSGTLYHVTIPIDAGLLAEFDDMDYVDVELTKQVMIYRASPDPMYYSWHAAGLPSSVHVYAMTAERPAVDVKLEAGAYGHIWTAPERPKYMLTIKSRVGPARQLQVKLTAKQGQRSIEQEEQVLLRPGTDSQLEFNFKPTQYGLHDVQVSVTDGAQVWTEYRDFAYLREDTRERGDWDFGRGPLYGFYNWGGGHGTPSNDKQLLVMAKAGIETIQGSMEENVKRHGEETQKVIEKYKLMTMKFAGGGDHYVTANFAGELKTKGLEVAKANFLKTLNERKSTPGPNNRPIFLSFYPEPSLGEITHGIFPSFIGEPDVPFTDYERERYEMFRNGFVEGAKIIREHFPEVKNLLPHGDPAFVVHFLQNDAKSIAPLLDGVCVDIPCFERLPEMQFHQVALHRLYMTRSEMTKHGIKKPMLPMYEGPCVPSGPGALTDQEQADITIRNSLILQVYGIDIQNGGFPAFDTSSYWGEQHYGFGVLNRVSLETPKIAYTALATLTRHLNRANYEKWVPTGSLNTYALQFKHYKTGKLVHVMWTIRGKRPVTIEVPAGAKVAVFDQHDNELKLKTDGNKVTFTVDGSPCYVEGLDADAKITLGEPNHTDSKPGPFARKLANFGDGSWTISKQTEKEYEESHTPYIYRYPVEMKAETVESAAPQGGKALAVHFDEPEKDRVFVPYYSVLKPAKPIEIPGKASHFGLWVKGNGDWGRAVYFCRDAKGEQWINVGTRGSWNCDDLHSWMSFNFDGWRYLKMELPANSGYDAFREPGNAWWGPYSTGDGNIDLPLTLEKVVVERRTHVMYVDDPQPADMSDVLLGDLYVEYADPNDAKTEAVQLASVRMPVPQDVKGLGNPLVDLEANGVGAALKIDRITLPNQEADGTQCYVHFPEVAGAKQYDLWVAPYADGRGALQLGKAWKAPGGLIRGLRPYTDFYIFATYTDADGKMSKPSAGYKINLVDFFGMK